MFGAGAGKEGNDVSVDGSGQVHGACVIGENTTAGGEGSGELAKRSASGEVRGGFRIQLGLNMIGGFPVSFSAEEESVDMVVFLDGLCSGGEVFRWPTLGGSILSARD